MIIIGQSLNSAVPDTCEWMERRDEAKMVELMTAQERMGAMFLDLNTAQCSDEADGMRWLVDLVLRHTACGVSVDSPDAEILRMGAEAVRRGDPHRPLLLNSLTPNAPDSLVRLAADVGAFVVVMPIGGAGYPETAEARVAGAMAVYERLMAAGVSPERVLFDAMVESVAMGEGKPRRTLQTVALYREAFPSAHVLCGLSNVSFGMPGRSALHASFAAMAVANGMDAAIVNLLDPVVVHTLMASLALWGDEDAVMDYIAFQRKHPEPVV